MIGYLNKVIKQTRVIFFLSLLTLSSCGLFDTDFQAKVVGVKDGDSIEIIDSNRQTFVVRLSHIDCPEYRQPFSNRARQFTRDFCLGKEVVLEQTDVDRFDRLVCEVFVDGKSLNMALVENGLAWHHKRYSSDWDFAEAEKRARKAKVGLWADPEPVPPWEWRRWKREMK